jgi:hypothetical protein
MVSSLIDSGVDEIVFEGSISYMAFTVAVPVMYSLFGLIIGWVLF